VHSCAGAGSVYLARCGAWVRRWGGLLLSPCFPARVARRACVAGPPGASRGQHAPEIIGVSCAGPRRRQTRDQAHARGRAPALPGFDQARLRCPPDALRTLLAALSAPRGLSMCVGAGCAVRRLPGSARRGRAGASHWRAARRTASRVPGMRALGRRPEPGMDPAAQAAWWRDKYMQEREAKHDAMADAGHQRVRLAEVTYRMERNREQRREAEAALAMATEGAAARIRKLHRSLRAARRSLGNERRQRDGLQALLERASGRAEAATAHAADLAREAEEVAESRDDLRRELGDAQRQARVTARHRKRLEQELAAAREAARISCEQLEQQLIDAQDEARIARERLEEQLADMHGEA